MFRCLLFIMLSLAYSYSAFSDEAEKSFFKKSVIKSKISKNTDPILGSTGFTLFESGQVRPLALSENGKFLYAVNTPDNRLEIFRVTSSGLSHRHSVPVGMEPVAVAVQSDKYVWVVNHLSDSVSIVDLRKKRPTVIKTLYVGDEPRDIVFAGANGDRAFITSAHRGQNLPMNPRFADPNVGRADVWVFDVNNLGDTLGGEPINIINLFGDTPRGLAVGNNGDTVYAAIHHSANQTTVVRTRVPEPLRKPPPFDDINGIEAPSTGLMVRFDGEHWRDNGDSFTGTPPAIWDDYVPFTMPDYDVFAIDANADIPHEKARFSSVGTTLFNMVTNPENGNVYITNTEARNHVRFEGPGTRSTTVRGHIAESRITVIETGDSDTGAVKPRHLNKHITSYDEDLGTEEERMLSVAQPLDMTISSDGERLFVAGFASNKIAMYKTSELDNDSFEPSLEQQVVLDGGGPTGVVLDETHKRLYVLTRYNNSITIVDSEKLIEKSSVSMFNPEPESVVAGRPFLYDASLTSSRGDSSCGICHIFGDRDYLAWDLGNPDAGVADSPNEYLPFILDFLESVGQLDTVNPTFHPMKGPMTTQTFRGIGHNGPLHWRGDRTGENRLPGESLEAAAFKEFNEAFVGLNGREHELTEEQMQSFTDFVLQIQYPPQAVRNLDNSLTPTQALGLEVYNNERSEGGIFTCLDCHTFNPEEGFFGTSGHMVVEGGPIIEDFKVPQLRALYEKVGAFGSAEDPVNQGDNSFRGPQVKSFGYGHGGEIPSLGIFLSQPGITIQEQSRKDALEEFLYAMDSDFAPIVGQQVTLNFTSPDAHDAINRIQLLMARAQVIEPREECDLIVKMNMFGKQRGAVLASNGQEFILDSVLQKPVSLARLLKFSWRHKEPLTFTCVPPGNGARMGVDRNANGILDGQDSL